MHRHRFCQWPLLITLKSKRVCTSTTTSSSFRNILQLKIKAHHHRFQLTSPWCNSNTDTDRYVCTSISLSQSQKNHYEVLGVERLASTIQIREAFLKLSKEFHPDINANDPQNHQKFVLLNEAYTILSKPLSRRDYDLSLQVENHFRQHKTSPAFYRSYGYQADTPYYHHRNHVDVDWDGMPRPPSSQEKDKFHSGKRLHRILVNYYSLSAFLTIGILAFLLMSKEILVPARKSLQQKDVNMHDFIMTSQHEGRTVLYYAVQDGDNPELFKVLAVSKRQSSNNSDEFEFEELNSV